ncbi:MAG TPA: superinfection immunity protein [Candidatus Acidoferrales bacterium]
MTGHSALTAADFVALLLFLLLVFVYWSPYLIAMHRKSDKSTPIALTLFFVGLTGVGWIIALIWALRLPRHPGNEVLGSRDAETEPGKETRTAITQEVSGEASANRASASSQILTPSRLQD